MNSFFKKTLAFQIFHNGREYHMYAEGGVEGFKEPIEGPPNVRDDPGARQAVIIINRYPILIDQEIKAFKESHRLASPIRNLSASVEAGSCFSDGAAQGSAKNNLDNISPCKGNSE